MTAFQAASIGANILVMLAALGGLGKWLRTRFRTQLQDSVSAPLAAVLTSVDTLVSEMARVREDLANVKTEVTRANERMDRHLESIARPETE